MHKTKKVVTFDLMQSLRGAVWKSCSEKFSGNASMEVYFYKN